LKNPYLDEDIQPLALTEEDIDDVVPFLASLTSPEYDDQGVKELARQRAISRMKRPQRDSARAFGPKPSQVETAGTLIVIREISLGTPTSHGPLGHRRTDQVSR